MKARKWPKSPAQTAVFLASMFLLFYVGRTTFHISLENLFDNNSMGWWEMIIQTGREILSLQNLAMFLVELPVCIGLAWLMMLFTEDTDQQR